MICDICGAKMKHYEAGEEWRCPNRAQHARIESQKRPENQPPVNEETWIGESVEDRKKRKKK